MKLFLFVLTATLIFGTHATAFGKTPAGCVCTPDGRYWYRMPDNSWRVWSGGKWVRAGQYQAATGDRASPPHPAASQPATGYSGPGQPITVQPARRVETYRSQPYVNYWGEDGADEYFFRGRGHFMGGG